jgi:PDZ domain-containing secreted protein
MRPLLTPTRILAGVAALVMAVLALLFVVPAEGSYIFLPDEAHLTEPLVTVEGGDPEEDDGGIYYVDVIVRKATVLERIFPSLREGSTLVPAEALNPHGTNDEQRRERNLREMARSQRVAAAVALRELGYDVEVRQTGALISEVVRGTPAEAPPDGRRDRRRRRRRRHARGAAGAPTRAEPGRAGHADGPPRVEDAARGRHDRGRPD